MKQFSRTLVFLFGMLFFDPVLMLRKWLALPYFIKNWRSYKQAQEDNQLPITWRHIHYCSHDRFSAGTGGHYFFQDIWAAKQVLAIAEKRRGAYNHIDVGSRIDGFVAHLLPYCKVTYVDIRPLKMQVQGLEFSQGAMDQY